jgi:2',3'-cyclic-nucleotide 2'-phosphodiesterase (5'-nucleotidase family)
MADNQRIDGHFRLYSYPDKYHPKPFDQNRYKKLVVISSNDFNGKIIPRTFSIKNRYKEKRYLSIGGLSAMRAYRDVFKEQFNESLLFVDSGSFLNLENNHQYTVFLYNYLSVDVAALGSNEFNLDTSELNYQNYLESLTKNSNFNIVSSNLFDLTKAKELSIRGVRDSYIKEINGVKVGFIGALSQSMGQKDINVKMNGIFIQNAPRTIMTKANRLRKSGAQVIVLLTNSTIDCSSLLAHEENIATEKVNFYPKSNKYCDTYNNNLVKTLSQISPNTIDLVITSGKNVKLANIIHGHPIMQNPGNGQYLSWAELYFDTKHKQIEKEQTILHQPIQLCHSFLASHQDCYTGEDFNEEELVPATFLGKKISIKPLPKL